MIIVVHMYLLKELWQSQTQEQQPPLNNTEKKVILKNCAPFADYISEINNTKIGNAKDIDVVMPMNNLV